LNQSRRDRAAKDTIGLHSVRQLPGESASEFCLLRLRLASGNAGLERERNARSAIHPELNDGKEAVGLIVREKSESSSGRQSFAKGNGGASK
jgi:hypothetical protein